MNNFFCSLLLLLLFTTSANAKLVVQVEQPKRTGGRAVVKLRMKNIFAEKIESARATVFLLNAEGTMVGQSTQWVIGGTKDKPALAPDVSTNFNFVIATEKPFAKAKVIFNRVVLEGGKVVESKDVEITE
jgi:hypothetical protein